MACSNHRPVQHQDGLPPWCAMCGKTKSGIDAWQIGELRKKFKGGTMQVKRYRVRPDNQEAVEVTKENMPDIAKWCGGIVMEGMGIEPEVKGDYLYIPTVAGPISARLGEIVAKDSNGRFSVFDKDRFVAKYEEVGLRMTHHDVRDF